MAQEIVGDEIRISVPGHPVPAARARQGAGGRWYTPKRTREYEELVAWHCRANRRKLRGVKVLVRLELHTKRVLRGDLDNYAKAILDGMVKSELLSDDSADVVAGLVVLPVVGHRGDDYVDIVLHVVPSPSRVGS